MMKRIKINIMFPPILNILTRAKLNRMRFNKYQQILNMQQPIFGGFDQKFSKLFIAGLWLRWRCLYSKIHTQSEAHESES